MSEPYPKVMPPGGPRLKRPPAFPFKPRSTPVAPPAPTVEAHPDVTEGKKFPCAQCGAALHFDPSAQALKCGYCGHVQPIPAEAAQVNELSFQAYFAKGDVAEQVLAGAAGEARCGGCGAMVVVPANVKMDLCSFCGSPMEHRLEAPRPIMAPGGVLPFGVDTEGAQKLFRQWVKSRWFAPGEFKRLERLDRLRGMYVPYWTYDAMTYSFYSGERGDHYYVTVGFGKNRRTERRTRWTPAAGRLQHFFDDVTICASESLPRHLLGALEPWSTQAAQPYRGEYLSGFTAERYQIAAADGFGRAQVIMHDTIARLVRQAIGGDVQRVHCVSTQIDGVTFKYLLLPVWIAAYRHGGKVFRVLVNGRTGQVSGERPWSGWKIAGAVVAAAVLVAVAMAFFMRQ